jgi:glycosyltransferase involved in cell wall biosynthesis
MRVLQIYELNPFVSIGGVEIAILNLSKELVKLGHEVTILTGACNGNGAASQDGIELKNFDFLGAMRRSYTPGHLTLFRQILFLSALLSRRADLDMDVYHGHIYSSGLLANTLAGRFGGVSVNTIHGSYYPAWRRLRNPLSASFYRTAERQLATRLSEKAHLQIHVSSYFADQVREWGDASRVKVIPNGVDAESFNQGVKGCLESEGPVILTARRLVKKNGLEYLIRAMDYLVGECRLVIIGDGPERRRLMDLARGSGDIEFLGTVPHAEMPTYIASADVAVVPSIIEASSLFMLEAMAMAKPVVASDVGGLPEALGGAGVLVQPMDPEGLALAIKELLSDPGRMKSLGNSGRERVKENFTWQKIAERVDCEYKRLWSERDA